MSSSVSTNPSPSSKNISTWEDCGAPSKRVRRACDRCRMKKVKCDGQNPCIRCKVDNVVCCSKEGQKIRHRNFPKGYAEMLEKQHNQMVHGLQELYYRLLKASLWEGEPLDVSTGRPLTHDILASLNLLNDQEDDNEAEFIENPRLSLMLERNEHNGSGRKTSTKSIQGSPRVALHKPAMSFDSQLQEEIGKSRSPSYGPSPTTPTLHHPHEQAGLHSNDVRNSPIESLPEVPRSFQPDILWTDTSNLYDTPQVSPSQTSSFCSTNWPFSAAFMLPSSQTQLPMSCSSDMLDCKTLACKACPLLQKSWFDNSVDVDNIESMSSPTGLAPQDATVDTHFASTKIV